ncbi:MAG: GAF domain-containing protein [Mycobacteriales bacterium]
MGSTGFLAARTFLELLARDAPAAEFDEPLRSARTAGLPAEEIARLEATQLLALQVRGVLERRRRRETELTALYETVGDLAALHDLDAVLAAIVRRARLLLGTDLAYLTLIDEARGDTYMRVTDGSVSARFQAVRLEMGEGLGGLVAQTKTPYATPNYFTDQRFQHSRDIDGAVEDEGLTAILGVPLLLGTRAIGVLLAGNRTERPFAREEVALLASLAAHAAVAIDNARLLTDMQQTLSELAEAGRLISAQKASVERAADAHDRLADLVLAGGDVQAVADAVVDVLGGDLLLIDAEGRTLARSGTPSAVPQDSLDEALRMARASGRAVDVGDRWIAPVLAGGERLGVLLLEHRRELAGADRRIFERAALVTALLLLFQRTVADAEARVRGELLHDLLTPTFERDPDALRLQARRFGLDLDVDYVVVVVHAADADLRQRLAFAATALAKQQAGLSGELAGEVVLLLRREVAGDAARLCARELGSAIIAPVTAGAAGPALGQGELVAAYRHAQRCLAVLLDLGREGTGSSMADLGFIGLVLGERGDVAGFVRRTLGPVLDYDSRRGTKLLETLAVYFARGGNLGRAKDDLHVHVNTVAQRLERVGRLLGADWQSPQRALEVQVALQLHRLRQPDQP